MSETCQKLAFTHPIVVLRSGLKNNWIKKLDRVNQPLAEHKREVTEQRLSFMKQFYFFFQNEHENISVGI